MAFLREYRAEPERLSDLLPWAALVAPGVVLNKDGSFLAAIRFRGDDPQSAIDGAAAAAACGLDQALAGLGSGWTLHLEARRRRLESLPPPEGGFPDPVSWLVEAERREAFEQAGDGFVTDYHLALQYLRPRGQPGDALGWFESELDRLVGMLAELLPEVVPLLDAALLSWLAATVATAPRPVAMPETPAYLDELLAAEPLAGGPRPRLGDCQLRVVSITGAPGSATPALLDALDRLGREYRWAARTIVLGAADQCRLREARLRSWFARRRGVAELLPQPRLAGLGACFHDATVTLWEADPAGADAAAQEVEQLLNRQGVVARHETLNAVPAWLSSLPGQAYADVRRPPVGGLGVPQLLPMTAAWAGPEPEDGPPPLLETRGPCRTPFRLPFAVDGAAHKLAVGPAGPGRAALVAFLALQARRYPGGRIAIIERGEGTLAATMAVGGSHRELRAGAAPGFQPLAAIDLAAERRWALHWLLGLLPPAGPAEAIARAAKLGAALDALAERPRPRRTLSGLCALLGDGAIGVALAAFCADGPFGPVLDAADEPALDEPWLCLETAGLADSPALAAALLAYLLHRLPAPPTGAPSLLILSGVLPWLDHPTLAPLRDRLEGPRHQGVLLAAEAAELLASPAARGLLAAFPARLFLPDPAAEEADRAAALSRLGLSAAQGRAVAAASPGQCYYRSPAGNRMLDLDLGEIARAFCAASGAEDRALVRELVARHGRAELGRQFLRAHGLAAIGELAAPEAAP
jgi:type IV secretion system protein VirB4